MMDFAQFRRPQRYIGNEWNVIKKSHKGRIPVCIGYPDLYELGMSNLGLRIIYSILNEESDIVCERVFMPFDDLSQYLKENDQRLFSLESKTPLNQFQVLGFNFNAELNYTNFLHILELGGIPRYSHQRKDVIVLGGGVVNPEPIADFIDIFVLGEFEAISNDLIKILRSTSSRQARIEAFSQTPGFYIPQLYSNNLENNSYLFKPLNEKAPKSIKRVFVKDLDNSYYPTNWLTPHTAIIQDRVPVEIARGCPNLCTFCQARKQYYPYRQRKPQKVKEIIKKIYKSSGYENFSLLSLSASDYSYMQELLDGVLDYFREQRIGLSLPSLRIDDLLGPLQERLQRLKSSSLTVAVEAAQDKLRKDIQKNIDIKQLFEAAKVLHSFNFKQIKLYFMYGFPNETNEDIIAIADMLKELLGKSNLKISASVNVFMPKPISIWESQSLEDEKILEEKRALLLNSLPRSKRLDVSLPSTKSTILETLLARGDRTVGKVIENAYRKGALFCGDNERFKWAPWKNAIEEEGSAYQKILKTQTSNFAWSFIDK
ncbi:MAG: TIGR03960 family B12-binding radical SAM protein [Candidatus Omnitrophota bacterium]|nr:MAG: TIGR03960 family B12-binding radical SAM protein [Candidatus Omnitrophota bacterium]